MKGTGNDASQLWSCIAVSDWSGHLEAYPERLAGLQRAELAELDRFLFADVSVRLEEADQPQINVEELSKLVDWKLKRGKWRPRLLDLAKSNSEEAVKAASGDAFALVHIQSQRSADRQQIAKAIGALSKLKGVGPATASAALSLYNKRLPFMSDEAIAVTTSAKPRYTLEEYLAVVAALQQKANELQQEGSGHCARASHALQDITPALKANTQLQLAGHEWTARDVERALWSSAHATPLPPQSGKAGTKRKWA